MLSHAQYREAGLFIGGTNYIGEVGKTDNLCTKQGNSSIFEPKVRGL